MALYNALHKYLAHCYVNKTPATSENQSLIKSCIHESYFYLLLIHMDITPIMVITHNKKLIKMILLTLIVSKDENISFYSVFLSNF